MMSVWTNVWAEQESVIRVAAERSASGNHGHYNGGKRVQDSDIEINQAGYWYALYPVWLLNTTWRGEKFTFAMNGQTGKMVGACLWIGLPSENRPDPYQGLGLQVCSTR